MAKGSMPPVGIAVAGTPRDGATNYAPAVGLRLGLPMDVPVPPGGYAWWYFDATSDCGQYGLCVIAFVGNVFSPHYAQAQRRGGACADAHLAINVVLYGQHRRWFFCEEPAPFAQRGPDALQVQGSSVRQVPGGFTVSIDARQTPGLRRLRGQVTFCPQSLGGAPQRLDSAGRHTWWPVAPVCRAEVDFAQPCMRWRGRAYHDVNWGSVPLAEDFAQWSWLRAWHPAGTLVLYVPQAARRRAAAVPWGALYSHDGGVCPVDVPRSETLPRSLWGLRPVCPGGGRIVQQLEDTPFYTRTQLSVPWQGAQLSAYHEYLDLERWSSPWVQFLVPFRLRRRRPNR